jgi:hypothetical protein
MAARLIPMIYFENLLENGKYLGRKKFGYGSPDFVEEVKACIAPDDIFML